MSGIPNKRSCEEGGAGQSSALRYSRDDSSTYSNIAPKLPPSASNDYHDMAPEAPRLPKIPRTESRDVDQRRYSPHRVLQTILYGSQSDHPMPSEDRSEQKDAKNSNRDPKVDIRDTKTDSRELYQGAKVVIAMDERKAENREKERKDFSHDKDKPSDIEKDHVRIDARTGTEKEGLKIEKEIIDVSVRAPGQENLSLDRNKVKDSDRYKESNDRKKERNTDVEGEKSEKHPICFAKELDHGGADAEGGAEREREGLNYGIQQRKRTLRPRGSPQVGIREPCFRSQDQDNEGPKGKLGNLHY